MNNMSKNIIEGHRFIVFGADHYNPLTVIRSIGKTGMKPDFIAIKNKGPVASCSKYINKVYRVDSIEEGYEVLLKNYSDCEEKPFLITTDDDVQSYLDMKYDELIDIFVFFHAGRSGRVTEFMDKGKILELAKKHGLKTLPTFVVNRGDILDDLPYPVLTKSISPNIGGWKADVFICNNSKELSEAYTRILSPKVVIQPYLDKKNEYTIDCFAINKGKQIFAPMCSMYNYVLPGYYSPYMTFYNIENPEIVKSCQTMLEEVGYEGICDFEFLVDKDDNLYFSEINFRVNPWSYSSAKLGIPFPILWAEAMLSGDIDYELLNVSIPKDFTAMIEPVDYSKRVVNGDVELGQWLIDFKKTQCPFYYDEDDIEPFLEMSRNWELYS